MVMPDSRLYPSSFLTFFMFKLFITNFLEENEFFFLALVCYSLLELRILIPYLLYNQ